MKIAEILTESTNRITDNWFKDGFKTYKIPAKEKYEIADQDGTVKTLEGPVSYKKGDYIMTGPKGEQYPMPPEKFRELKDDQGNGIATPKKIVKMAKLADHDGVVNTSWGAKLEYTKGNDYIVKHGPNDYGVVKAAIFAKTYKQNTQKTTEAENLDEITRRNLLKGIGATAAAGALGAKVDLAKAAGEPQLSIVMDNGAKLDLGPFTSTEDAMKMYDEYWKIIAEFYMGKKQQVPDWELHLDGKPTGIKATYPKGLGTGPDVGEFLKNRTDKWKKQNEPDGKLNQSILNKLVNQLKIKNGKQSDHYLKRYAEQSLKVPHDLSYKYVGAAKKAYLNSQR